MNAPESTTKAVGIAAPRRQRRGPSLVLAIFLGILFQALCFLRIGIDTRVMLPQQNVLATVFDTPIWHSTLFINVAFFVLAHLVLAGGFGILCWLLAGISVRAWPSAQLSRLKWTVAWLSLGALWLIVANAALYPWSSLGEIYGEAANTEWAGITAFDAVCLVCGLSISSTLACALWKTAHARAYGMAAIRVTKARTLALVGVVATALVGVAVASISKSLPQPDVHKPNIILIGIDSLRADIALENKWGLSPNVSAFLRQSVTFTDAITPLARTFPSWVSILTGREPQTTGAYINLLSPSVIHTGETLPQTLRKIGYKTQYAIDEVRFSNVDASYGFDRIATPRMGASDFVLANLNDTPLSNMLLTTRVGAWLFPDSYANRAAATTYDPDTFVKRVRHEFEFEAPTFTAIHLTLAHWPYSWATSPIRADDEQTPYAEQYKIAVRRVDQQFADMIEMLRREGALANAIVIVMSDHGEAIGTSDDHPYVSEGQGTGVNTKTTLGHGTSILSPHQYRVVLGMKFFGFGSPALAEARRIDAPVSLIDLAPTVVELLQASAADPYDGLSLAPLLHGQAIEQTAFLNRVRFTQTEFNPPKFKPGKAVTASMVANVARYYVVEPDSDRILFRETLVPRLLRERQYAAIQGSRMLAALPNKERTDFNLFLTTPTGGVLRPVDGMHPVPEAAQLRSALEKRFSVLAGTASVAQ
jgi:hypothetical protein